MGLSVQVRLLKNCLWMTAPEDIAAAMNAGGRALGPDLDCIRHIEAVMCYGKNLFIT